ncbi:MAG: hypothetical protein NT099_01335 [Candidatus Saganbacteria bacterium]|nr:hypothetical protein [Candidatus Saganbacteria bacterium]
MGEGLSASPIRTTAGQPVAAAGDEEREEVVGVKPAEEKSRIKFTPIIAVGLLDAQAFIPNVPDKHIPIVYPKVRTQLDIDLGAGFALKQTATLKYGHIIPILDGQNPDGSAMVAFAEEAMWGQYKTGIPWMPVVTIGNDNRYKFGGNLWMRGLAGSVFAVPGTPLTLLTSAGVLGYPYEQKAAVHKGLASFTWLGVLTYTFNPHFKLNLISEGEYCPDLNNGWMNTILEAEFPFPL